MSKLFFVSKVFLNLLVQAFVAYTSAVNVDKDHVKANRILYRIASVVPILILAFSPNLPIQVKFMLLTAFSSLMGMLMSSRTYSESLLRKVTMMFAGLFIIGVVSAALKLDFRVYAPFLLLGLFGLVIARLFMGLSKDRYKEIGVILFAMFVVYDTNNIMQKNYGGDFVNATLDYFTDIINLLNFSNDET